MEKKTKNVFLEDPIHTEVKIRATKNKHTIQKEVNDILRKELGIIENAGDTIIDNHR